MYPFRKLDFFDDKETVDMILNGKSMARIGDGELRILKNIPSAFFQSNNEALAKKIEDVVESSDDNLIICIPKPLKSMKGLSVKAKLFWISNIYLNRKHWRSIVDYNKKYGNTQITRPYMDYAKKERKHAGERFENLKRIWKNKRICIIEGERTHLGEGNNLFEGVRSITRIIAPSKNAFKEYGIIFKEIKREREKCDMFILALGPTATVLAGDICANGDIGIDIGHVDIEYEWMLRRATKKQKIEGKYVNEAGDSKE